MSFNPYIFFDGNCAEVIDFYAKVFGAENVVKMPFSEAPAEAGLPKTDRLMHAQIDVGGATLMCSDVPPGAPYYPQASVSVAHQTQTVEDARTKFEALAKGGDVIMPFETAFFSSGFGMCKDRFGTHWMIMVDDH